MLVQRCSIPSMKSNNNSFYCLWNILLHRDKFIFLYIIFTSPIAKHLKPSITVLQLWFIVHHNNITDRIQLLFSAQLQRVRYYPNEFYLSFFKRFTFQYFPLNQFEKKIFTCVCGNFKYFCTVYYFVHIINIVHSFIFCNCQRKIKTKHSYNSSYNIIIQRIRITNPYNIILLYLLGVLSENLKHVFDHFLYLFFILFLHILLNKIY